MSMEQDVEVQSIVQTMALEWEALSAGTMKVNIVHFHTSHIVTRQGQFRTNNISIKV